MEEKKECTHSGSKKKIFMFGSYYRPYGGSDETEDIYICHDCGTVYLRRYEYSDAIGEERIDIIVPGETKHGVTFHEAAAAMIKLVQEATSEEALKVLNRQAGAIKTYVLNRLEQYVNNKPDKR